MDGPAAIRPRNEGPPLPERVYRIGGGRRLEGTVTVGGAKNAVTKQMVATLLTDEPCILSNVPRIAETDAVLDMLADLGTQAHWLADDVLRLHTPTVRTTEVNQKYSGFNRIPILLLGPLLHRAGRAVVPTLGGCRIGPRPVDFHLSVLEQLGAKIDAPPHGFLAEAGGLTGAAVRLPYASVGATETALLSAVLARGTTVIDNAAIEPEIGDTIRFLQKMGARITPAAERRIIVEGVPRLHGASHAPLTDRIEVASFAVAAVATAGRITVRRAEPRPMRAFLRALRQVGGGHTADGQGVTFFRASDRLAPLRLETDVHPGFMTDWQQPFAVLLTQADGRSRIHETVYENRFGYTAALRAMGANVVLSSDCLGRRPCRFRGRDHLHSATIAGPTPLEGRAIAIPDLRAGFAYVIAALVARGETELRGIPYLERGYAHVPAKLAAVGARIDVIDPNPLPRAA